MNQKSVMASKSKKTSDMIIMLLRLLAVTAIAGMFIAAANPARLSGIMNKNASLFSSALSYSTIGSGFVRALSRGWINQSTLSATYYGALIDGLACIGLAVGACICFGELKLKRLGSIICMASSVVGILGNILLCVAYNGFTASQNPDRIEPIFPMGITLYFILFVAILIASIVVFFILPKPVASERYEMRNKYKLFLMILPFMILVVVFSYLPLWGWRYAFFDFRPGFDLTLNDFVGLKWLNFLFSNPATRADIVRVLKNTFGMSGIGIATSWMPMAFAIFLAEIRSNRARKFIQTFTTIPNFISWVLVYSVGFALFSTEGFVNSVLLGFGAIDSGTNYLMDGNYIWLKMWLWGSWKGLGWGSIIYIAAITGIDQQLYEAATVDGAGRFKKMWHITVPGLLPTFFVMLMLSIANILSNGMDQYLVFYNATNRNTIQVLDLYVYQLGLASGSSNIPLATLIGMLKSVISVTLLFGANKLSSLLRGENII